MIIRLDGNAADKLLRRGQGGGWGVEWGVKLSLCRGRKKGVDKVAAALAH